MFRSEFELLEAFKEDEEHAALYIINELITNGESLNTTIEKKSLLAHALYYNKFKCFNILLKHLQSKDIVISYDKKGRSLLYDAIKANDYHSLSRLIECIETVHPDIFHTWLLHPDKKGQTAFHWSVEHLNLSALELLINKCKPKKVKNFINQPDFEGNSPLHMAYFSLAQSNSDKEKLNALEIIPMLIHLGANYFVKNDEEISAQLLHTELTRELQITLYEKLQITDKLHILTLYRNAMMKKNLPSSARSIYFELTSSDKFLPSSFIKKGSNKFFEGFEPDRHESQTYVQLYSDREELSLIEKGLSYSLYHPRNPRLKSFFLDATPQAVMGISLILFAVACTITISKMREVSDFKWENPNPPYGHYHDITVHDKLKLMEDNLDLFAKLAIFDIVIGVCLKTLLQSFIEKIKPKIFSPVAVVDNYSIDALNPVVNKLEQLVATEKLPDAQSILKQLKWSMLNLKNPMAENVCQNKIAEIKDLLAEIRKLITREFEPLNLESSLSRGVLHLDMPSRDFEDYEDIDRNFYL